MYRVVICDDESFTCQEIETIIHDSSEIFNTFFSVDVFYSGEALIEHIRRGDSYDFMFLDIELLGISGIDVGKFLRNENKNFHTQIIFISSKETYAMKLFSIQPLDFIVKPIDKAAITRTLMRGLEIIGESGNFFTYKVGREMFTLSCKEILYLMSDKRIISIVSRDEVIEYYGKLANELILLPDYFVQIHKSYVVNLNAVKKCCNDYVIMNNGDRISVSRKYADSFKLTVLQRWRRIHCEV